MIAAHGGKLISRVLSTDKSRRLLENAREMQTLEVSDDTLLDMANIATGSFSPLEGFMGQQDLIDVLASNSLQDGTIWTLPVVLPSPQKPLARPGEDVILTDGEGRPKGLLHLEEVFAHNQEETAQAVFGTTDLLHPGVKKMAEEGSHLMSGKIELIKMPRPIAPGWEMTPLQTREAFRKNGWQTITGFQTRNVPHRAHEYLQKVALEITDGILLHPLVGWKKSGDYSPSAIMRGYQTLIRHYYPKDRALLAALATKMRYAGPKEAIFHAIIRKNFGCTHFIIGRDHAGVGGFYRKYEAHEFVDVVGDLGIEILKLKGPYYCKRCESIATEKTCPHPEDAHLSISGTQVRAMLAAKEKLPKEFMRPEVSEELSHEDLL